MGKCIILNLDKKEYYSKLHKGLKGKWPEICGDGTLAVLGFLLIKKDDDGNLHLKHKIGRLFPTSAGKYKYAGSWAGNRIAIIDKTHKRELYKKSN